MAKLLEIIHQLYACIPDFIWPHLTGKMEAEPEDKDLFIGEHSSLLNEANATLASRVAETEARSRTVDFKLGALLALTSVYSAITTAGLAAAAALGKVDEDARVFAWVAVVLVCYVAVQLLRSLWVTVAGLMRRSYRLLSQEDMAPRDGETRETYLMRLWNLQANCMSFNEWAINQKVGNMTVAHTALRNALTATFGLVILVLLIASVSLT